MLALGFTAMPEDPTSPNSPPLLIDPAYDVHGLDDPTADETAAFTDAPHGENPELIEDGDER